MSDNDLPPGAFLLPQPTDLPPGAYLLPASLQTTTTPEDKYQQAAQSDYARNPGIKDRTSGIAGYTGRVGMGIPWSDEIQAGLLAPIEMARHGTMDPREGYYYAKARENLINEKTRENTAGLGGTMAEISGGLGTGAGVLGGTRAGAVTLPKMLGGATIPESVANYGLNTGKAIGLGGFAGAGEGDSLADRTKHGLVGAGIGGALGGVVLPIAAPVIPKIAAALQMPRLRDPEKIATEHIAKVANDAGVSMEELGNRMAAARAAGQTDFTIADALGKEGQRKLAAVAKVAGPARDNITEILTARDLNMPQRVGEALTTKFNAPGTAAQETERLIKKASDDAKPYYKAAEDQPGAIWNNVIGEGLQNPDIKKGLAFGVKIQRTRSAMGGEPFNPTDAAITGFDKAGDPIISGVPNFKTLQTAKIGLDAMIQKQTDAVTGRMTNYGAALVGLKNRLNDQIAAFRPDYATANRLFSDPMRIKEAVQVGKDMARRGRPGDTVPAFQRLNEPEKQGVRIGWADSVLEPLERTGNFPTMLRAKSPKGQAELEAMSPYGPATLREMLAREETMQRTSRQALGGSQTAENLADMAQAPGGASALGVVGKAASGNFMGAVRDAAEIAKRIGTGESEAQRSAIARALLASEPDAIAAMQRRMTEHELRRRGVNPFVNRPPRYRQ